MDAKLYLKRMVTGTFKLVKLSLARPRGICRRKFETVRVITSSSQCSAASCCPSPASVQVSVGPTARRAQARVPAKQFIALHPFNISMIPKGGEKRRVTLAFSHLPTKKSAILAAGASPLSGVKHMPSLAAHWLAPTDAGISVCFPDQCKDHRYSDPRRATRYRGSDCRKGDL